MPLTGKAFDTLCCLIDHRDRVVGKDELLAEVWAGRVVEENNLTQAISALRRALGQGEPLHRHVPGRGYRFVADLSDGRRTPGAPGTGPTRAGAGPAARSAPSPACAVDLGRACCCVLGVFGRGRAGGSRGAPSTPPSVPSADRRLAGAAVPLAFAGSRDELLELGLAETLIARISGSTDLARALAFLQPALRRAGTDPLDAGRQLGAAYVVEGTTQRGASACASTRACSTVRDGSALWSGTFDERIDRVFTLQDGIAAAVSSALACKLDAAPRAVAAVPAMAPMRRPIAPI